MIPTRPNGFGNRLGDLREKRMGKIGQQQTDRVGAAGYEAPRHQIRAVVQFLGALQHSIAGTRADSALIAEGLRDRHDRDFQILGDIGKGGHFGGE